MDNTTQLADRHVGDRLSGYLDGELTQQDRQRVELHCASCADCATTLAELRALRERVGQSRLSEFGEDKWRETMDDSVVTTTRSLGWLLLIGIMLIGVGIGIVTFLTDTGASVLEKVLVGGVYVALALLFVSVLRQRLIERTADKYKDVEI